MVFCELCNIAKGRNHDQTQGHLNRLRYFEPSIINKCDLCQMGFLAIQGYNGHINSNIHLQNIQNQNQSKSISKSISKSNYPISK